MTDNIKLPPLPNPDTHCFDEDHATDVWSHSQAQMQDYAREAVRLNATVPDAPNWRHPKIQGLIGSEARLRIAIDLIWQILEDPNQEFTASDMEYWDTIHDKLKAALSAAPAAPQRPTVLASRPIRETLQEIEMAHTPGPWTTLPEECDKPYIRVRGTVPGGRFKIANVLTPVYEGVHQREAVETRANARLIAAAPDLLEALQRMVASWGSGFDEGDSPSLDKARAAIAKATGGTVMDAARAAQQKGGAK